MQLNGVKPHSLTAKKAAKEYRQYEKDLRSVYGKYTNYGWNKDKQKYVNKKNGLEISRKDYTALIEDEMARTVMRTKVADVSEIIGTTALAAAAAYVAAKYSSINP